MHIRASFVADFGYVVAAVANDRASTFAHDEHRSFDFQVTFFVG
jgi:hypothetical protein